MGLRHLVLHRFMAQAMLLNRGAKPANCANLKSAKNNAQQSSLAYFLVVSAALTGL